MKCMIISGISLFPAVITALLLDSCIYDAPGDRFYRTLWKSQEATLGTITLDFLCDGAISVKSTAARFDDYGTYQSDGPTASLYDLSLIVADNQLLSSASCPAPIGQPSGPDANLKK